MVSSINCDCCLD